jgi:hypothetical protein
VKESKKSTAPFYNKEESLIIEQNKDAFVKKYNLNMYCDFVALMQTDLTATQRHLVITIWDSLLNNLYKLY